MLHRRPFSWQHIQNTRQFFIWILFVWYGGFFVRHKNNFYRVFCNWKSLASKAFKINLLLSFLVVNRNHYCCLPTCRFYNRLTVWILNLKPTHVILSSGKYNCSCWHPSWLRMLQHRCKLSPDPHLPKTLAHIFACSRGFQINGREIVSGKDALE